MFGFSNIPGQDQYLARFKNKAVLKSLSKIGYRKKKFIKKRRFNISVAPELKNFDTVTNGDVSSVSTLACINPITTGTSSLQMLGRRCILKAIQLNYTLAYDTGASTISASLNTNNPTLVRVMLIYDTQPDGALPQGVDILNGFATPLDFLNLNNTDRFSILYDKWTDMGMCNQVTGAITYTQTVGPLSFTDSVYKKCSMLFEGPSTAGMVGISHGAVYLMYMCDRPVTNTQVVIRAATRVRFADA